MVSTRVRLTDQALVAVTVGRARAETRRQAPTVVDLILGLAVESDGAAGQVLRERSSATARIAELPVLPAAPLDTAVLDAASAAAPRPAATLDLLYAALDVGGSGLVEVLTAAGWEPADLLAVPPGPAGETLGLRAEPRLTAGAATAVARTRAAAGGAVELLYELADGPDADELGLELPPLPPSSGPGDDAGIDAVLDAARRFRPEGDVTATDVVRAAIVAGGRAPRRLMEKDPDG